MIAAIVPAAGMSTRMGRNKLLLAFEGKALIAQAVDTLLESEVDEIIVVLGHEADKVKEKLWGNRSPLSRTLTIAKVWALPSAPGWERFRLGPQPL
jgi:CTP:molybdopterin cytidylyltransferase MocA